ncbi:MAG: hypothetical protein GY754_23860 [bacterium]|nr:hypothetical protein [bacterium]
MIKKQNGFSIMRYLSPCGVLLLFLAFLCKPVLADNSLNPVAKQKRFVKELYLKKNYFDTIGETRRLMILDRGNHYYSYFINSNYFLGAQYKTVVYNLTREEEGTVPGLGFKKNILVSQSFLKLGFYERSSRVLQDVDYSAIDPTARYELLVRKIEPYIYVDEYEQAIKEIERSREFVPDKKKLAELDRCIKAHREMGCKYPALSVTLSVLIPGAGQIYSGRYLDGLFSFLGVALMAAGTWYFYDRNEKGLSYTAGFFTALFYAGNIYGAYNSASQRNIFARQGFRNGLLNRYIPRYRPLDRDIERRVFE